MRIFTFVMKLILSVCIAFLIGTIYGKKEIQWEAVKAGVAHYITDEQGNPKFVWKTIDHKKD